MAFRDKKKRKQTFFFVSGKKSKIFGSVRLNKKRKKAQKQGQKFRSTFGPLAGACGPWTVDRKRGPWTVDRVDRT